LESDLLCKQISSLLRSTFFVLSDAPLDSFRRVVRLLHQSNTTAFSKSRVPVVINQTCSRDNMLTATCTSSMTWGYPEVENHICETSGIWSVQCPVYTMHADCSSGAPGEVCHLIDINETESICLCDSPFMVETSNILTGDTPGGFSLYVSHGLTSSMYHTRKNSSMTSRFIEVNSAHTNSDNANIDTGDIISLAVPVGLLLIGTFAALLYCRQKYSIRRHEMFDAWKAANNGLVVIHDNLKTNVDDECIDASCPSSDFSEMSGVVARNPSNDSAVLLGDSDRSMPTYVLNVPLPNPISSALPPRTVSSLRAPSSDNDSLGDKDSTKNNCNDGGAEMVQLVPHPDVFVLGSPEFEDVVSTRNSNVADPNDVDVYVL